MPVRYFAYLIAIALGLYLLQGIDQSFGNERTTAEKPAEAQQAAIDPALLGKVRPLYPDLRLKRGEGRDPYFSIVRDVVRLTLEDGTERLIVEVRWIVPSPGHDLGGGAFLLFEDAAEAVPIAKVSSFVAGRDIRVVENQWVRFGNGPLVSLLEDESLQHFSRAGERLLDGLSRLPAKAALEVYLKEGLDAFLKWAPIRAGQDHRLRSLPDRVSRIELYPSLVEDFRTSGFRYSSPWEGTVLVRLTPADGSREPVILEMGAKGWAEGITNADVELVLQETRDEEPTDRPGPEQM